MGLHLRNRFAKLGVEQNAVRTSNVWSFSVRSASISPGVMTVDGQEIQLSEQTNNDEVWFSKDATGRWSVRT